MILLYNTVADASRAARLHDDSCSLVTAARGSRGKTKVIEDDGNGYLAEVIADLEEREWPVKKV